MMRTPLAWLIMLAASSPAMADGLTIKPGQWEQNTTASATMMAGGNSASMPVKTEITAECLLGDDARIDPATIDQEGCNLSDVTQDGRVLTYTMVCQRGPVEMDGTMKLTVSEDGTRVDRAIAMSGRHDTGIEITSSIIISSRWTGDC